MISVDAEILRQIAPRYSGVRAERQTRIIDALAEVMTGTFQQYQINSRLRLAHFLAQACHEAAGFTTTVEFWGPTPAQLGYEGRKDLGNTQPGDGKRYMGRGIFQLTGRANYISMGDKLKLDLVGTPDLAAEPATSLLIGCEYWNSRNISPLADADDLYGVTRKINGGKNGIEDRRVNLTRAKAALARVEPVTTTNQKTMPTLRRGSKGEEVASLQMRLRAAGYSLAVDGDFGAATELAVMHFETSKGQTPDGIVGPETWKALPAAA